MALLKKIIVKNGLPLEYHKVSLISIEPNQQITILRDSYLNAEARQYEKDYAAGLIEGEPVFPYVSSEYIHMDYADNIAAMDGNTMESAYNLLKKHCPELADAENI